MRTEARGRRGKAAAVMGWEWRHWIRKEPGRVRFGILLAVPLLYAFPFEWSGLFGEARQGVGVVLLCAVVVLALGVGHRSGRPVPEEFWFYQKGASLVDRALGRWVVRGAMALLLLTWWVFTARLALHLLGVEDAAGGVVGDLLGFGALFLLLWGVLFAFGAAGVERSVECTLLVCLLYFIHVAFGSRLPDLMGSVLSIVLPPFGHALALRTGVRDPLHTLELISRVGIYLVILLGAGSLAITRRVPEE